MAPLQIIRVSSIEHMRLALAIRRAVFIEEQGVAEDLEIDDHDGDPGRVTTCIHVLGTIDGAPVATGRLLRGHGPDQAAHIGRVAVLAPYRGQGHGRSLMTALHSLVRELGYHEVVLAAQTHAVGFYAGLGYEPHGDVFLEAQMPHQEMRLRIL